MKRAGIITFHCVYNVGAALQTFALYHTLESLSEAVVVDYYPWYHRVANHIFRNPFNALRTHGINKKGIREFFYLSCMDCRFLQKRRSVKKYQKFLDENIKRTRRFYSYEELKEGKPVLDVWFAGSDQIWNKDLTGKSLDDAYLLKFVDGAAKKISYAASVGREMEQEELYTLAESVKGLDRISVREQSLADRLSSLVQKPIETVLDPTFLLERSEWMRFIERDGKDRQKYILVYALEKNKRLNQYAKWLAKQSASKVMDISPIDTGISGRVKKKSFVDPVSFLNAIYHADYIVTNSFHGTAFSLIFEKDFLTFAHSARGERMRSLLRELELDENLAECDAKIPFEIRHIAYRQVNLRLQKMRQRSLDFIERAFEKGW